MDGLDHAGPTTNDRAPTTAALIRVLRRAALEPRSMNDPRTRSPDMAAIFPLDRDEPVDGFSR